MTNATVKSPASARSVSVRKLAVCALLSAMATILMFVSFGLPILPSYLKVDFSELPALLASFALGPVYGVIVCLIKNLFNLPAPTTGGVGEMCNFLLGALFVLPAGILYRRKQTRSTALLGMVVGTLVMAVCSFFVNLFVVYPAYMLIMPEQAIVDTVSYTHLDVYKRQLQRRADPAPHWQRGYLPWYHRSGRDEGGRLL